jgi:hypothetical protein
VLYLLYFNAEKLVLDCAETLSVPSVPIVEELQEMARRCRESPEASERRDALACEARYTIFGVAGFEREIGGEIKDEK